MDSYIVAFRYTRKTKGYHGIMTWTRFPSKEYFDNWYTPELRTKQEIVEEGITQERAIELTHQTPFACRIAAAFQEATDRKGKVHSDILEMKIEEALLAEQYAIKVKQS